MEYPGRLVDHNSLLRFTALYAINWSELEINQTMPFCAPSDETTGLAPWSAKRVRSLARLLQLPVHEGERPEDVSRPGVVHGIQKIGRRIER